MKKIKRTFLIIEKGSRVAVMMAAPGTDGKEALKDPRSCFYVGCEDVEEGCVRSAWSYREEDAFDFKRKQYAIEWLDSVKKTENYIAEEYIKDYLQE
jgi:hypothetical protein